LDTLFSQKYKVIAPNDTSFHLIEIPKAALTKTNLHINGKGTGHFTLLTGWSVLHIKVGGGGGAYVDGPPYSLFLN
jgi:hypothetical protein